MLSVFTLDGSKCQTHHEQWGMNLYCTLLLPASEQCSSSVGRFLFQIDTTFSVQGNKSTHTHTVFMSVSPHLRCIVSDSVKSGRCWPARTKRSRSHLLVSDGRNKAQSVKEQAAVWHLHQLSAYISSDSHTRTHTQYTHLQDLLNTVDGGGEQSADLLVIVNIVGMSQAHEQDVGWQTWDQIHGHTARLQLWRNRRRCTVG